MSEATKAANRLFYQRHKEEEKARSKAWRLVNPEKYKLWAEKNKERRQANSRKHEYNLSPEAYEAKLTAQEGKCAICAVVMTRPDVDHNHACCPGRKSCGKCVRGILCHRCNTVIGLAGDSIELLSNAIKYLGSYSPSPEVAGSTTS